ncbi:uncharacterized protein LOC114480222 [Gouania willdenowi]|uniref:uncharacterized protein LOC114480222 n=1 Tax=Gouania willdenowi TaxID=441366 RepID=UPI0010548E44|nr:uncharacterized protein LOC114480222 [Gouania willdenowi]
MISEIFDFEDRAESCQSGSFVFDHQCLSPDSPLPQFTVSEPTLFGIKYRSTSPQSVYSEEDLETDLCLPWLFEDRAESPDTHAFIEDSRPLSPDSPLPEFTWQIQESFMLHSSVRSLSPESVLSDLEMELSSLLTCEDRCSSPDSDSSLNANESLSPDSPVPDFCKGLSEVYSFVACQSSSPASEASDIEFAPLISQIFDFEDRAESCQSELFEFGHQCLSPDSPLPQFTVSAPTVLSVRCTSPQSVYSEEDFETDLCLPWLFEERAESPDGYTLIKEFRPISPDTPIPECTWMLQESFSSLYAQRSSSPESVLSDLEMELSSLVSFEDRCSSPDSDPSLNVNGKLSPDSPVPAFYEGLNEVYSSVVCQSSSPVSEASDLEFAPMIEIFDFEDRAESCQSGSFVFDHQCLSPDSPLPQFTVSEPTLFGIKYRSTSPQSVYSEEDLETDLCLPWLFEDRAESPDAHAFIEDARLLSPDSPIPDFTWQIQESFMLHSSVRSLSPESVLSDLEMELSTLVSLEDRSSSPDSDPSLNVNGKLSPDSPVPHFYESLSEVYSSVACQSSSPVSEASDLDLSPSISQISDFEDRAESCQSGSFEFDHQCLSPDSPLPQFTVSEPTLFGIKYRSTSPQSVYSEEDLETDLCLPWLFEDRAESPDTHAFIEDSRLLSPDSPIPEFTWQIQESFMLHSSVRSLSPESVLSDLEMELSSLLTCEDRCSSPDSDPSLNANESLSPDSPVPDFCKGLSEVYSFVACQSSSPVSEASDLDFSPSISQIFDFEDRAESCQSGSFEFDHQCLSPDSPLPQFTVSEPTLFGIKYRSTSPQSVYSEEDLETDLCLPWLFEDRAESPDAHAFIEDARLRSPDSPILEFTWQIQESFMLHSSVRSLSPESVLSDLEMELSSLLTCEDRCSSPDSDPSFNANGKLSPDSPVPHFYEGLSEVYSSVACQSSSPVSEASDLEFAPMISQIFDFEDGTESRHSGISDDSCVSPDSPLPQFTSDVPTVINYRSITPDSVDSNDDIETYFYGPCFFEARAESPDSAAINDTFRCLSPDSPIPEFTLFQSVPSYVDLRSSSYESLVSDIEMDYSLSPVSESRPFSPESVESGEQSADSPIPDFVPALFTETTFGERSTSVESTWSDDEYIFICIGSLGNDHRTFSPASADESEKLPPESPIPDYTSAIHDHVVVNIGYHSPSPDSIDSDIEYALGEILISKYFGVEDRRDSMEAEVEFIERTESVDSISEYIPMSPTALMQLEKIKSESPESTQSLDETKRLSPDSPLPWFTQNIFEQVETNYDSLSPQSLLSDEECDSTYCALIDMDKRASSPQSEILDEARQPLAPNSSIPDFTKTFGENVISFGVKSPTDNSSPSSSDFCPEEILSSPKADESAFLEELIPNPFLNEFEHSDATEASTMSTASKTELLSSEELAVMVAEYNLVYDAELWKLISQIRDPLYAGETFRSKTGFMQFVGSTIEYESALQENEEKERHLQDYTHEGTSTEKPVAVLDSDLPRPITEELPAPYRVKEYTFETQASADEWVILPALEDDYTSFSPESSLDYTLMPQILGLGEERASSPESVQSINAFRRLSPDSPIPEFLTTLPRCVKYMRSTSSSPETVSPDLDVTQHLHFRSLSPGILCEKDQDDQSLPKYRVMSFEPDMWMAEKRASSPESAPEYNGNRSLSPDSPIPHFTLSLQDSTATYGSLSPESQGSDSECELIVTSWSNRPSSPESISSVTEFRPLLPDSPVPEFMRILSSYFM